MGELSEKSQNDVRNDNEQAASALSGTGRKCALFVAVIVVWVAIDQFTKTFFKDGLVGKVYADNVLGLFDFRLVHNTGGAWGIFSDSTFALGMFSLAVCAIVAIYFFVERKHLTYLTSISLALIVAGGLGNVVDRFALGYVIDFIEFTFIDFPVFNVADIGVTCGFALLVICLIIDFVREDKLEG